MKQFATFLAIVSVFSSFAQNCPSLGGEYNSCTMEIFNKEFYENNFEGMETKSIKIYQGIENGTTIINLLHEIDEEGEISHKTDRHITDGVTRSEEHDEIGYINSTSSCNNNHVTLKTESEDLEMFLEQTTTLNNDGDLELEFSSNLEDAEDSRALVKIYKMTCKRTSTVNHEPTRRRG